MALCSVDQLESLFRSQDFGLRSGLVGIRLGRVSGCAQAVIPSAGLKAERGLRQSEET
jgi:hypothetical protein